MDHNYESFIEIIKHEGIINNRFKDLSPISNKGGFSIVFKGYDITLEKDVALKFFDPFKRDEYRLKCFHREAELLADLRGQPNIVELIEGVSGLEIPLQHPTSGVVLKNTYEYYVLELAETDIEEFIYNSNDNKSDNKSVINKLVSFREMCKSVARIHRARMCHRHLKPSNFLICKYGEIKLSDLGTATILDGRKHLLDEYPFPVGDMGYWAPEEFCNIGICDDNAFLADIFSLGAILFEMFTKTRLANKLYTPDFISNLIILKSHLSLAKSSEHLRIFNEVIDTVVTPQRLPDIFSYNNQVPNSIKIILNNLYKGMAALNYLKRYSDFESIYRQINLCILILKNEHIYRRWKLLRERRYAN
jgi:serine/threonine protein kinase